MSGIFDQIINYSPPLIVSGTVNYKGTWNASTNNPTLNNPPATSTKGDYYVVSTAGTQFTISFAVGDWIISSGTAWEKVDLTDAVSSVFGRTGAVVGVSTDYSSVGLTNTAIGASSPSTGAFTTVTASSTIAATGAVTGSNLSGTNTGDQTTITGNAGSATVLQTPRAIYGNNFDGSAALTQVIASTYGGTGNGFAKFSGPASSEKTFTLPNASSTLLYEGGTIGATTANTGAFTTLTATGTVTALGASFGGATGTGATGQTLNSQSANGNYVARFLNAAGTTQAGFAFENSGADFATYIAGVERSRLTSTGLNSTAIGATTASTGVFTNLRIGSATSDELLTINGSSAGFVSRITSSAASNPNGFYYNSTNAIGTGTAFRVDSQGVSLLTLNSTGLAVTGALSATGALSITATAASSISRTLSVGALIASGNLSGLGFVPNSTGLSAGYNYSGGDAETNMIFGASSSSQQMRFQRWDGTTLTNVLTLVGTGNVGIGTSSPADTSNFGRALDIQSSTGAAAYFRDSDNTAKYAVAGFFGADSNAYYGSYGTSTGVLFYSSGLERARIDSSGNFFIGSANVIRSGDKFAVSGSGAQIASFEQQTNTSGFNVISSNLGSNGNNTSSAHFWGNTNTVGNWYLYGNGTTSYSSDSRLKKNIVTTRNGYINDLCKLRVVKYNWKNDADGAPQELGLIAQEVEEVFPNLVQDDMNPVEAGGQIYKQLKQSVLPFMLLKALQELNANLVAQVAALSQRIAALETK